MADGKSVWEYFDRAPSSGELWHGLAMTAVTWIVVPYVVYVWRQSKCPGARRVVSAALCLAVVAISAAHMGIARSSRSGTISLHGKFGWVALAGLGLVCVGEVLASVPSVRARFRAIPSTGVSMWKALGLSIAFLLFPAVWFFGFYDALGILEDPHRFRQAGGHTLPGGGMMLIGANMMYGPIRESKRLLVEGVGLTVFGILYIVSDLATGYFQGIQYGMAGVHHLATSICWFLGGALTLILLYTKNTKYNSAGVAVVTYVHIQVMLSHPSHGELFADLHALHATLMSCALLVRIMGNWYLAGLATTFAGTVFISSQIGITEPLMDYGVHFSVYMMIPFTLTLMQVTYFSLLFTHTKEEIEEEFRLDNRNADGNPKAARYARVVNSVDQWDEEEAGWDVP